MCRSCNAPDQSGSHDTRLPFPNGGDQDTPYPLGGNLSAAGATLKGAWTMQERLRILCLRSRVLEERLNRRSARRTEHTVVMLPDAVYTDVPVVAPPQAPTTGEFFQSMLDGPR